MQKKILFLKALSVFLGTVIGVGIFGLPFVTMKAGFFIILPYFALITFAVIMVHLLYAEVVLGTEKFYRLPGYAAEYMGLNYKKAAFLIIIVGFLGALLAYLIVGGEFLNLFLKPYFGENLVFYTILFFFLGSYLVFLDIKSISRASLFLLAILLAIIAIFLVKTINFIDIDYFKTLNLKFLAFPYGVILFSLWGSAIIPEIEEMFIAGKQDSIEVGKNVKRVIVSGLVFTAIIYLLFIFIIFGVSGPNTSEEAISGLYKVLGNNIVIKLGFIFGLICCFTSFIAIALTLKKVFLYDFGFSKKLSLTLTLFPPIILFFLGVRGFINVINFTGALSLGAEAIITIFLYKSFLKKKFSKKINSFFYLLILIFALGMIFEAFYFFLI